MCDLEPKISNKPTMEESMKKSMLSNLAAVMMLLLGMASTSYLNAQDDASAPQQQPQANAQSETGAQPQDAKVFTGTIMKKGGSLVLKDMTGSTTYQLDDQKKVKSYFG
jgi:hypothetical protein